MALVTVSLVSCTAPVELPETPTALIETYPSGASVVTDEGVVLSTPVRVPCPPGKTQAVRLLMPGHAERQVVLVPDAEPSRLSGLSAAMLLPMLSQDGRWERVEIVDGRVILELEPLHSEALHPEALHPEPKGEGSAEDTEDADAEEEAAEADPPSES